MFKARIVMGNVLFASRCVERDATIIIFVAKKVEIFENRFITLLVQPFKSGIVVKAVS